MHFQENRIGDSKFLNDRNPVRPRWGGHAWNQLLPKGRQRGAQTLARCVPQPLQLLSLPLPRAGSSARLPCRRSRRSNKEREEESGTQPASISCLDTAKLRAKSTSQFYGAVTEELKLQADFRATLYICIRLSFHLLMVWHVLFWNISLLYACQLYGCK